MNDIKVGNKVFHTIKDGNHILGEVKSIDGDSAVVVSEVNETELIIPVSSLIRITEDNDS